MDKSHSYNNIRADITRYFTGAHEVQECLEGQKEIDLHTHLANCKKNPGHTSFIPKNNFKMEHLPSGYRDSDFYDLTEAMSDLTVRIAVKFTSPFRPKFVSGTTDPYPCYDNRGKSSLRTGSGRLWWMTKYTEDVQNYRTCPCPECIRSGEPSKVWWQIDVRTATHVVYDGIEARLSSCRLWFDDEQSPNVNIYGWRVAFSDFDRDWSWFYCATHDIEVADKVEKMLVRFVGICEKVKKKYKSSRNEKKLTIVVSHPHGCSKQVSVGQWVHLQEVWPGTRYTYTACTCPGSSGASVYTVGCHWAATFPHCGANLSGLNYSGVCGDYD